MAVALEEARRQQRPALIFFHAEWSAASRAVKRDLWSRPAVRRAARGMIAVEVDVSEISEANEERAARFEVDRMPTFLLLDRDGRVRARFEGAPSADELVRALEDRAVRARGRGGRPGPR